MKGAQIDGSPLHLSSPWHIALLLQPGKIPQQPLDYCFTEGEEITFFTEGPGDVHLTGLFYFEFLFFITIIVA